MDVYKRFETRPVGAEDVVWILHCFKCWRGKESEGEKMERRNEGKEGNK
jgi:hypothetical protein